MNFEALARRRAEANQSIKTSVAFLAERLGLFEQAQKLEQAQHRDPQVAALFQLEAIADLLRAIAEAAGYEEPQPPPIADEPLPPPIVEEPVAVALTDEPLPQDEGALPAAAGEGVALPEPPTPLDELLEAISPRLAAALAERGITTPDQLAAASDEDLLDVPGIGPATLERIRDDLARLQGD